MAARLSESITIETDLFEHRQVKPDFINPCCFGEDFAAWLQEKLVRQLPGGAFVLEAPCMEDYGWGFGVRHAGGSMWVALSYAHEGPVDGPATWVVSTEWQASGMLGRWLRKPDEHAFGVLATAVRRALESEPLLRVTGR